MALVRALGFDFQFVLCFLHHLSEAVSSLVVLVTVLLLQEDTITKVTYKIKCLLEALLIVPEDEFIPSSQEARRQAGMPLLL